VQRIRPALASLGVGVLALAATIAGAPYSSAAPSAPAVPAAVAAPAAGPSASQLLAQAQNCTPASNGRYATDEGSAATVSICRSGSAYVWTSDMDIDCDGITTSHCNSSTDPSYFDETSFETSKNQFFTADTTHYYVIPLPSSRFDYQQAGITPGSVAAVVYNNKVVYAVFADEGPSDIIGEASYATASALGIDPDPATGGTDGPVTFIVFPGHVPNPVENNSTIDSVGSTAATSWLGAGGGSAPPSGGTRTGRITGLGGKCVDVSGAGTANGTPIDLYTCNGTNAHSWTVGSAHSASAST
jgi:hypothetical protein